MVGLSPASLVVCVGDSRCTGDGARWWGMRRKEGLGRGEGVRVRMLCNGR